MAEEEERKKERLGLSQAEESRDGTRNRERQKLSRFQDKERIRKLT